MISDTSLNTIGEKILKYFEICSLPATLTTKIAKNNLVSHLVFDNLFCRLLMHSTYRLRFREIKILQLQICTSNQKLIRKVWV